MKEASAPPIIEEEKASEKDASKIARPRPAAGEEEESIQRAAGDEIFATILC